MQDQERRELVSRLRAIIFEAFPRESARDQDFELRQRHALAYPFRRRQAMREIGYLVDRWGWRREVDRVLHETGANGLKSLDVDQLQALLQRLRVFEDALQTAADMPDSPPAR